MSKTTPPGDPHQDAGLIAVLAWYAIVGCALFALAVLIADFVVPGHDAVADTISDLGAGRYEFIVDIGLYAFSAALIAIALLAAHVHMDGWRWSAGVVGFALFGLIVFLVGARNEYGDSDNEGFVIHIYLVYAIGALMAGLPWAMAEGAGRIAPTYRRILIALSLIWALSAPFFFFMPDGYDGLYERYLGLIAMAAVVTLAWMFLQQRRVARAP